MEFMKSIKDKNSARKKKQTILGVANDDLNVGTIECDTLVIEQSHSGSTSGGMNKGYYYDDKPVDPYYNKWYLFKNLSAVCWTALHLNKD